MPTYVYKFVETGETIEVQQAFTDDTLTEYAHPDSGEMMSVKKVFQPVGVTFKGSGFFKNDNRGTKTSTTPSTSNESTSSDSSSKDSGSTSSDSSSSSGSSSKDSGSSSKDSSSSSSTSSTSSASSD